MQGQSLISQKHAPLCKQTGRSQSHLTTTSTRAEAPGKARHGLAPCLALSTLNLIKIVNISFLTIVLSAKPAEIDVTDYTPEHVLDSPHGPHVNGCDET
jgi:hypothetical protein